MGTNIEIYTEKKSNGTWMACDPIVPNEYYGWEGEPQFCRAPIYDRRNYEVFALLAGVRNRYYIKSVAPLKGLPQDLSEEVRREATEWVREGRLCSYLTLAELQAFDWHGQTFVRDVSLKPEEFVKFMRTGRAEQWHVYKDYDGRISNEEMCELIKSGRATEAQVVTYVCWTETYAEPAKHFLETVMPKLEAMAQGNQESVRIVFSFDCCCNICASLAGVEIMELDEELIDDTFWYCRRME